MKHVRILGRSLVAVFAVSAMTLGIASQAMAKETKRTNSNAEYEIFQECPWNAPGVESCFWGQSSKTSFFKAGNVLIHLIKPITIQGGLTENPETGSKTTIAANHGPTETLVAAKQPAPSLEEIIEPASLSPSELARYEAYIAAGKSTKTTATVELAGTPAQMHLREGNLLEETGVALELPTQVKLTNKFLGSTCYEGSFTAPIPVELTTGESGDLHGSAGQLEFTQGGSVLHVHKNKLVDATFPAPGVTGCGIDNGADAALDAKLGLPSATGNEIFIEGELGESSAAATKKVLEPEL